MSSIASVGTPASSKTLLVPPVEIISKPFATQPAAHVVTPVLSETLINALLVISLSPLQFVKLFLGTIRAQEHEFSLLMCPMYLQYQSWLLFEK